MKFKWKCVAVNLYLNPNAHALLKKKLIQFFLYKSLVIYMNLSDT